MAVSLLAIQSSEGLSAVRILSYLILSYLILSYLSRSLADRWGTTVDFTTSFLHSSPFSAFRSSMLHSRPVHSLMLSSRRFLCQDHDYKNKIIKIKKKKMKEGKILLNVFLSLEESRMGFCMLVACLTSRQHASASQGRLCSDKFTCCHTEIESADQIFYLTQSQYTDTGPTNPSADPLTPGAWQGGLWSANF